MTTGARCAACCTGDAAFRGFLMSNGQPDTRARGPRPRPAPEWRRGSPFAEPPSRPPRVMPAWQRRIAGVLGREL